VPPLVSVIIPVKGDAAVLEDLLGDLGAERDAAVEAGGAVDNGRAVEGNFAVEIIVSAATPVDPALLRVRERHRRRGDVIWVESAPGRGIQLNAGAARATGEWLWFVHADSRPPRAWLAAFRSLGGADGVVGGAFAFALDSPAWQARLLERAVALRVRWFNLPYGDQGLFVRRRTFQSLGGFAHLVARFHDPTRGRILLNGQDIREFRLRTYRDLLAIVQQDTFLFDGSVRDNIAYGRHDASQEEVEDAARRANAHEFIDRLPDKYETFIGERGVKLSGGQQQRLAIARAILARPEILILDEATSNLDTESEQLIQASMAELLKGRTTFVIAHRLSTIRRADLILLLEDGLIVERGTHAALMEQRGMYHAMVMRQVEHDARERDGSWEMLDAGRGQGAEPVIRLNEI
jgi:ABC-type multidrug transport system ATPase subunit